MPGNPSFRLAAPLITMLGVALVSACSSAQPGAGQPPTQTTVTQPGTPPQPWMAQHDMAQPGGRMPDAPGTQAMMGSMRKMQQDMMAQPMTGDTDRDFAAMMREHHRGAVEMARTEVQYGKDPALKKMARKVISDQEREIRQLDQWLARHPPQQTQH